jgi:hypothetical protein
MKSLHPSDVEHYASIGLVWQQLLVMTLASTRNLATPSAEMPREETIFSHNFEYASKRAISNEYQQKLCIDTTKNKNICIERTI